MNKNKSLGYAETTEDPKQRGLKSSKENGYWRRTSSYTESRLVNSNHRGGKMVEMLQNAKRK